MAGYARMRASSADRERAIDVLKAGFTEGRLTRDELDDREGRVMRARTYGELAELTCDLPAGPLGGLMPASPGTLVVPGATPLAAYPAGPATGTNRLAIASLVLAFIPFWGTLGSVICGHFARRQIRQRGGTGDGLAIAGLIISYASIVLFMTGVIIHMIQS